MGFLWVSIYFIGVDHEKWIVLTKFSSRNWMEKVNFCSKSLSDVVVTHFNGIL